MLTVRYSHERSIEWWTISTHDKSFPLRLIYADVEENDELLWVTPCCRKEGTMLLTDLP